MFKGFEFVADMQHTKNAFVSSFVKTTVRRHLFGKRGEKNITVVGTTDAAESLPA